MTRLIDADALKEYIDCGHLRNPCEVCFSELDVVNLIDAQPTIDAVPVIRCKDCKWWREDSDRTCKHFYTSPRVANDFCSYAERKGMK